MNIAFISLILVASYLILPSSGSRLNPESESENSGSRFNNFIKKTEISFELDGKKIISSDYSCSYNKEGIPVFNLTVFHDRDKNPKNPPNVGFNIYNLRSADEKLYSQRDEKPWTSGKPVYGLGYTSSGKNLDEASYADSYEGATSIVTITAFDLNKKTASGTFSGTLVNAKGKSVTIKNGVFKDVSITIY